MKKIIPILSILMLLSFGGKKEEQIIIPKEAIRFRVIANSDSKEDQQVKMNVKKGIQKELYESVKDAKTITEARNITQEKLGDYQVLVQSLLKEQNQKDTKVDINYGQNYFPEKEYQGVIYPEGYYESLVITLGNGLGKNWWCVLFPPLCSLEAESKEQASEVEYKFFIKDLIDKYLK